MPSLRPQIRIDFDLADRIDAECQPGEARSTWVNDLLRDTFRRWDEADALEAAEAERAVAAIGAAVDTGGAMVPSIGGGQRKGGISRGGRAMSTRRRFS